MKELTVAAALLMLILHLVKGYPSDWLECPRSSEIKYFPDPESCENYYICNLGSLERLQCPNAYYFNPNSLECDEPNNAGCDMGDTTHDRFWWWWPPWWTTTKKPATTTTVKPVPTPTTRPTPPVFPPSESTTDSAVSTTEEITEAPTASTPVVSSTTVEVTGEVTASSASTTEEVETSEPSAENTSAASPITEDTTSESTVTSSASTTESVGECPAENGDYPVYLPHPTDCGKFYECDWGVPIEQSCPGGLHWSTELQVCTYPSEAGCTASS